MYNNYYYAKVSAFLGKYDVTEQERGRKMKIILASKSPRRREILELLGLDFTVDTADTDEFCELLSPGDRVAALATQKGEAVIQKKCDEGQGLNDTLIIACDTLVYIDGEFLGKPKDREDAYRMLTLLSGKSHEVWSGIYIYFNGKTISRAEVTRVKFCEMSHKEKERYLDSGEPFDKAGAYAVQGKAAVYIKGLEGDYFNVVGLPVNLLYGTLKEEFGIVI